MVLITITKADVENLATVQQIGKETFFETFAEANTEADMEKYLAENFSNAKIAAELNNPELHFFVAWQGENPVGYMKLNTGHTQTELQDPASLEIERIYVKSAFQGQRVGQLLYDKALKIARFEQKKYIWLGVWEENLKAIRFYEKNDFVSFDKHVFRFGEDQADGHYDEEDTVIVCDRCSLTNHYCNNFSSAMYPASF
jgi:ribosomal protein S18 acetylase RimI-like enzyme